VSSEQSSVLNAENKNYQLSIFYYQFKRSDLPTSRTSATHMILPHLGQAVVDLTKLCDYCLNSEHPRGKHKARVFESSLGMTAEHAEELRSLILDGVRLGECYPGVEDTYGIRYFVDFTLHFQGAAAEIRTAWMVRKSEGFPRLTTCYLK